MEIQYRALMPEDSFQYRQVRLESLKLHPECFGSGYTEQVKLPKLYFERLIEDSSQENIMLGAFHGSKLVGLCGVVTQSTKTAEIIQMYVDSDYRGIGLGVNLLSLAKKYASTRLKVAALNLIVYRNNESAIRAYEKSGFQVVESMSDFNENEYYLAFTI
ncbi:N-acetyltransferase [Photobacterium profundum]|uniref:Acetyltransferase, GNAT family protein n=2 Tax=Photobacterium profundum TaxID=74109 RepID=Q1YYI4_9GAMM|nr:GNAT family N-acetyltransferase [Photobacterium profundum]EAS41338.1 acetyltransferase, GNAT family protein [Photobacterium profundum 3TCK]PSV57559.1 N-acetyltransferase [Photobacterium profundum]